MISPEGRRRVVHTLLDLEYLPFYTQILGPLISGLCSPGLIQCNLQFSSESIIISLRTSQGFGLGLNCIVGFPVLQCLHHPLCGSAYAYVYVCMRDCICVCVHAHTRTYKGLNLGLHILWLSACSISAPAESFFSWLFTFGKQF